MATLILDGQAVEYTQTGPLVTLDIANHARSPDLLLVHSLLTELTVFEKVLPALAADRRVTCINLPGFGASAALTLDGLEAQAVVLACGAELYEIEIVPALLATYDVEVLPTLARHHRRIEHDAAHPELRGVGQAFITELAELPEGNAHGPLHVSSADAGDPVDRSCATRSVRW